MRQRIKIVRQKDSMQCGPAALSMICSYYGMTYSLDFLCGFCHATSQGVSMAGISQAAAELGLESKAYRLSFNQLLEADSPAILHWNQNHFVVFAGTSRNGKRIRVADPGKGMLSYSRDEFLRHWISTTSDGEEKGVAMFFDPTPDFGKIRETYDDGKRSFRFLLGYIREYRRYFTQIILGLLLACVLQLILPFLTQSIVDIGIADKDVSFIWLVLLGEFMIVAARTATDFIRRWLLLHISMRINISLLSDFFIKLLKLPMSFFDTKLTGDLMQRMGDHSRVQSFLTGELLGVVFNILSFIVLGAVLLFYDIVIFSVFITGSVLYGLWIAIFMKRRKILDYSLFECQAANQNKTYQFLTTMQEIKLQDCEKRRRWEWEDIQADLFEIQMKSLRLQQTQEAGSIFIGEIKNILITVLAASSVINGTMSLGAMLAVQFITGQLNAPLTQLMQFLLSLQDVKISLERINEIHSGKNEEYNSGLLSENAGDNSITLSDISFKYDPHSPVTTINNVSIKIEQGKTTAIVGASGSGKTTLVKLMLGFFPLMKGEIRIGKTPLGKISIRNLRKRCGVVMQEGVIFSESIARNIAVADGEIDIERLEKAARTACIHDYIMSLPLGYNTIVGQDGTGLSLGQKQRILIARAVYKNPDFLFLDEATNSLDTENERKIVDNLNEFFKGRTVVIVAHRLSTVRNADKIVVIDNGCVAESGTHEELVKKKALYYKLVRNQLELGE